MSNVPSARPTAALSRAALAGVDGERWRAPPVRIVHIGLGVFHRAHQAWFTDHARDGAEWGIAAFTGRNPRAALQLAAQDGLFTLIERAAVRDTASIVASIAEAVDGADLERFLALLSSPSTAIVTLTVTEAGYRLTPTGQPNPVDSMLSSDLRYIAAATRRRHLLPRSSGGPQTALGRLLLGLEARRRDDGGPIAIVPCDNIPNNGGFVASGLTSMASRTDDQLAIWIDRNVSFVSTSVDRMTPETSLADAITAELLTGWQDHAPVVTEPFKDWVLSGNFPAGRPAWETEGAQFVSDIEPFERRKLWLLNGAHSLLAYVGLCRGHETVADAMADQLCLNLVNEYWDEAARHLPTDELDVVSYRAALVERLENPRIEYRLRQIATDGLTKLRVRIVPVVLAERADGHTAVASIRGLGAWLVLILAGAELVDTEAEAITVAASNRFNTAVEELTSLVEPRLLEDSFVMTSLREIASESGYAR